jgi:antitoxin ParD1/3/4
MPTRNISLTPEMDEFVEDRVKSGKYANASEVFRAGLRALEEVEKEDAAQIEAIRAALKVGMNSGIAPDGVFERAFSYFDKIAEEKRKGAKV